MPTPPIRCLTLFCLISTLCDSVVARKPTRSIAVWTKFAPGETTANEGEKLPRRPIEIPPATRIKNITKPMLQFFEPEDDESKIEGPRPVVLILPGGGYNYVVTDKEGSEVADRLNEIGTIGVVLQYRTKGENSEPLWKRPVQDAHRAMRLLRANHKIWNIDPARIGMLGFSAGGQAAAIAGTDSQRLSYPKIDDVDDQLARPDFLMLIYPWNLISTDGRQLIEPIQITNESPPTFLVHAHDDHSTSMGSVAFYSQLKRLGVPAELHIYQTGGHGYGTRPVPGSNVHTWPDRLNEWLERVLR